MLQVTPDFAEITWLAAGVLLTLVMFVVEKGWNREAVRLRGETISYFSPWALLILWAPLIERVFTCSHYDLGTTVRVMGFFLLIFGIGMRIFFHRTWLRAISAKPLSNDRLGVLTDGAYSVVRHPMWLGTYSVALGLYLWAGSLLGVLCFLLIWVPLGALQIRAEEKKLVHRFSSSYETFRADRCCIVPFIW
ncbi:methyltransferase family protein [Elusimicrobiota bacterium]